jgi:hypothetical protein
VNNPTKTRWLYCRSRYVRAKFFSTIYFSKTVQLIFFSSGLFNCPHCHLSLRHHSPHCHHISLPPPLPPLPSLHHHCHHLTHHTTYHTTSRHITSSFTSHHNYHTSHHTTSHITALHHLTSFTSLDITGHHLTHLNLHHLSHHVRLHHIASHHFTSHRFLQKVSWRFSSI